MTVYFVGKTVEKPSSNKNLSIQIMASKYYFPLKKIRNPQEKVGSHCRAEIYKMSLEHFIAPNEKEAVKEY